MTDALQLQAAFARMRTLGVDPETAIATFEDIVNALAAKARAVRLAQQGDFAGSAEAGNEALQAALDVVASIAAPELNRILLAGILGVEDDAPEARSAATLAEKIARIRKVAQEQTAEGGVERDRARSGLHRVLLALSLLTEHNFLDVCAGSLLSINSGDKQYNGWIAQPAKAPGKQRAGKDQVSVHQAYTAVLLNVYYADGYHKTGIGKGIEDEAERLGIAAETLRSYKKKNSLQALCDRAREEGDRDQLENRKPEPPLGAAYKDAHLLIGPPLKGQRKRR